MKENLDHCLDLIGISEGGFSVRADDPPTNHGITQHTLSAWRGKEVSIEDVKALTVSEARQILASQYATPIRFDDLPPGLDYCVLDAATNSGPDRAARLLQQALGMPDTAVDGVVGLHTLAEVSARQTARDISTVIQAYCDARLTFLQSLAKWGTYGKGWADRVKRVRSQSITMLAGVEAAPSIEPIPVASAAKATGAVKPTSTPSGKVAIATTAGSIGTTVIAIGNASDQIKTILHPYMNLLVIQDIALGFTLISAIGVLIVALRRANAGGTS